MTTFSEQFPIVFQALNIGFLQTLKLFFVTLIGAIPLGLIISFGSMSNWAPLGFLRPLLKNLPKTTKLTWWQRFQIWCYVDFKPIRIIVRFIIWVVRGTPLMLQLLVFYYFPGLVLGKTSGAAAKPGASSRPPSRSFSITRAISPRSSAAASRAFPRASRRPGRCSA